MTQKQDSLGGVTAPDAEGIQNRNTNTHEGERIMDSVAISPEIAWVFDELAELESDMLITLDAGDPFFEPLVETQIAPLSGLREVGDVDNRVSVYGLDGQRHFIADSPEGWYENITADIGTNRLWLIARTPNAVIRAGDWLIVGRGTWYLDRVLDDGNVEWMSREAYQVIQARVRATARAAYLAQHPEIEACKPAWAESYSLSDTDTGDAYVAYERSFGRVDLGVLGKLIDGRILFDPMTASAPAFEAERFGEDLTLDDLKEFIADLQAAAKVWEAAL